ncbi:MAG: NrfD/PsrC family molybdoenzyme membrane anchor subunit [Pseudomonadota bacterium]|nr:NrfD/PsrC family molybdoenzyme membrane anchor subunit [Pseudomonadota bacterium]
MQRNFTYSQLQGDERKFYLLFVFVGLVTLAGALSGYYMEVNGHHVTGMNNNVVWGVPHVFAIFLIVAASGALNVASISSVFGKATYKPLARLSGLLAIALLVGGLLVLVLDLGRPDRLIVAMTTYNFKSIFAWNIFLYIGFIAIVGIYLWMMLEKRMNVFVPSVGIIALVWRLVLTTGTGSIFGFLVARQSYDAAVFAPLFIAMSFALGLAVFILILATISAADNRPLGDFIVLRLGKLLGIFVGVVLYFVLIQHLTNLYATEHHGVERFVLLEGGIYTFLFWIGQILIGTLIPLLLLFYSRFNKLRSNIYLSASCVIIGGFSQLYVIIIGGQAFPLVLFPGMDVKSSFFDGVVRSYIPTLPEFLLGIGGISVAVLIIMIGLKALRFLPTSLENSVTDPNFNNAS